MILISEQTLPATGRAWHLEARPAGRPTPLEFALREVPIPAPGPGQILVANEFLSVDPYMRGRMSARRSYVEPYEVGAPLDGPAVGRVLASRAEGFAVGDHVMHVLGWRDYAVLDAATAQKVDPNLARLSAVVVCEGYRVGQPPAGVTDGIPRRQDERRYAEFVEPARNLAKLFVGRRRRGRRDVVPHRGKKAVGPTG